MLGDREKCIQAQMDEYLSKPLKQNHLIQTILKCATLGGALLEKGRDVRTSANDEAKTPTTNGSTTPTPGNTSLSVPRPPLEPRPFTTTGPINHGSLESPAIVTADGEDPLARVRKSVKKHQ
jgi:osomolarity two-component system, sensor histidine kinase NIK1